MWKAFVLVFLLATAACSERPATAFHGTDISGADFGRALSGFKDQHGTPRTLADFRAQAVIVFFGYTSCPDICPTTLSRFAEVIQALGPDGRRVQVVFVTLDPERDTAQKLADYVPWFHHSFIALRGDPPATDAAAREFKVFFARRPGSAALGYTIDHSAGAYVFDPAGRIRLYLRDDAPVAAIAADLRVLLAGG